MSCEHSATNAFEEAGVFPSFLAGGDVPVPFSQDLHSELHQEIIQPANSRGSGLGADPEKFRENPEVQHVEQPPRPQMAAQSSAVTKIAVLDGIKQRTRVQTVVMSALQVEGRSRFGRGL